MATYTGIKAILQEFLRRALPSGMIVSFGGASAPKGWLLCNGAAVSRTTYKNLFSAIGTSYGAGDGSTTFNLPDLRESVPVGAGTRGSGVTSHDTYSVGTFKDDQYKSHTHSFSGTTGGMSGNSSGWWKMTGNKNGRSSDGTRVTNQEVSDSNASSYTDHNTTKYTINLAHTHSYSFSGTTGSTGGGNYSRQAIGRKLHNQILGASMLLKKGA